MDTINIQEAVLVAPDAEGLTSAEAAERLQQSGPNVVAVARPRGLGVLLRKFWGLIPWMLELAIILDLVLGRWVEAIVIAALLVFNALLGFFQESRAQRALALLHQRLTINARVRRDGHWQVIPAAEVVPDDVVHLRAGDIVPADLRLTDGQIQVDQSQLTGESLPVEQRAGSTAYAGSLVSRGEATGLVTATGSRTYFGKTAELIKMAEAPRRLELLIIGITRYFTVVLVLLAAGVVAAVVMRGQPLLDTLPLLLMLLIAAVPVALPAMFSMSAALGARALAENGILATRLSAVEDAASMDVLCIDKTGTLTENRLTLAALAPSSRTTSDDLLRSAALASDDATQDPIDLAILQAAREQGLLASSPQRAAFVPFDPGTKRSEVSIRQGDQLVRIVKGEPSTIAGLAHVPWPEIADDVARLSADGSRVLAVAAGDDSNLQLTGLIALGDPPRADSAALIAKLRSRGVRVLLVTGDGEAPARGVGARPGGRRGPGARPRGQGRDQR
jgi:H+-transporting ATPase